MTEPNSNNNNKTKKKKEFNSNFLHKNTTIVTKIQRNPNKILKKSMTTYTNKLAKKKFEMQQKAIRDKQEQAIKKLIFPNMDNLTQSEIIKFERDALVADFEKGFKAMLIYLNNKFPSLENPYNVGMLFVIGSFS